MLTIYIYVLDTLADWELGYVISELNSGRFFKKDAKKVTLKMVSHSKEPINTMGGLTIIPTCLIDEIEVSEASILLLPGANTWSDPKHGAILEKATEFLKLNATVCAICGATSALANVGLLDNRPHTSNGLEYLEVFSPTYKGQNYYIDQQSVADKNLITASCTGALQWTKQILAHLDVFQSDTLESWHDYFSTGDSKYFFALMESLPSNNES
ncbi:type 1 glutamine amidotransferase family protein [Enterococcus rivorum]|uniref:Glutamine amidotransferase n=1 Tax=Enterococcus rivorum TaxID=762845 RepID=A0A1E5KWK7_9ENTE|nr:type 1 glutamine amidotransferase family protein [Enterococcus rivorum]MBP2100053.1 putative intracellular protease/amidase [Enterococcus rivorum]OEH82247.1 glutamine amidotransferase [Enterococcus rivorum]